MRSRPGAATTGAPAGPSRRAAGAGGRGLLVLVLASLPQAGRSEGCLVPPPEEDRVPSDGEALHLLQLASSVASGPAIIPASGSQALKVATTGLAEDTLSEDALSTAPLTPFGESVNELFTTPLKPAKIGKIYYINMEKSVDRRRAMEEHLTGLGHPFQRVPATSFEAASTDDHEFTAHDKRVVREAFKEWRCEETWGCKNDDIVCCLGLTHAKDLTIHATITNSGFNVSKTMTTGLTFVGSLASEVRALRHITNQYDRTGIADPVIIAEDDTRFKDDLTAKVADAVNLTGGDWDLIKLASFPEKLDGCPAQCSPQGMCLTQLQTKNGSNATNGSNASTASMMALDSSNVTTANSFRGNCRRFWSTAALLVNPSRAGRLAKQLEYASKEVTRKVWKGVSVDRYVEQSYSIDWLLSSKNLTSTLKVYAMSPAAAFIDDSFNSTFENLEANKTSVL